MTQKSVNISGAERAQIERKAVDLFMKTSKARHPDENFIADISIDIIRHNWDRLGDDIMESPFVSQMKFENRYGYGSSISRINLPNDMYIYELFDNDRRYQQMLSQSRTIMHFAAEDLVIPEKFKVNGKYLYPFQYYGSARLWLSQEIMDKITIFNNKMEATYSELDTQLKTLIHVIDTCKTTKSFEAKLPALTSLYPNSVNVKIRNKNASDDVELTEEEKLMQEATNAIATANLLGD